MKNEYPKALYGVKGFDDLNDVVTVKDLEEEIIARDGGYTPLTEPRVEVSEAPAPEVPAPEVSEAPEAPEVSEAPKKAKK